MSRVGERKDHKDFPLCQLDLARKCSTGDAIRAASGMQEVVVCCSKCIKAAEKALTIPKSNFLLIYVADVTSTVLAVLLLRLWYYFYRAVLSRCWHWSYFLPGFPSCKLLFLLFSTLFCTLSLICYIFFFRLHRLLCTLFTIMLNLLVLPDVRLLGSYWFHF